MVLRERYSEYSSRTERVQFSDSTPKEMTITTERGDKYIDREDVVIERKYNGHNISILAPPCLYFLSGEGRQVLALSGPTLLTMICLSRSWGRVNWPDLSQPHTSYPSILLQQVKKCRRHWYSNNFLSWALFHSKPFCHLLLVIFCCTFWN